MLPLPGAAEMFADASTPRERAERQERLSGAIRSALIAGVTGETYLDGITLRSHGQDRAQMRTMLAGPSMRRALSSDQLASINASLASVPGPDLNRDWTETFPIASGAVPFDLEAGLKELWPRPTPWRQMIPRQKGVGLSHRFKVISGVSGSATGGVGTINPGINDSTSTAFGSLNLLRGPKITYAGYDAQFAYVANSISDTVMDDAYFTAQGFADLYQESATALLYASMLAEERLFLYARGTTANGYTGPLAVPGTVTAAAAGSGATLPAATYYIKVTADAGSLGASHESAPCAEISQAVTLGQTLTITVGTDSPGALGYNVYVSTSTGTETFQGRTGYNKFAISAPLATGGAAPPASDTSALGVNYDGVLTNLAANGGYVTRLNAPLSSSNVGQEWETAFGALYDAVKADPEETWMNGHERKQLSDLIKNSASTTNYRLELTQDEVSRATVGAIVSGILNPFTGRMVDVRAHPWFPQGNISINSWRLPIPDSRVSNTVVAYNVQDYVGVIWPKIQFSRDASSYWIGTLVHYAPAW